MSLRHELQDSRICYGTFWETPLLAWGDPGSPIVAWPAVNMCRQLPHISQHFTQRSAAAYHLSGRPELNSALWLPFARLSPCPRAPPLSRVAVPLIACLQYQRHTPCRFYGGASCVEDLASNTCIQATGGLLQSESSVPENVNGVDDTTGGGLDKRSCIPHGPSAARQDRFWQLSAA